MNKRKFSTALVMAIVAAVMVSTAALAATVFSDYFTRSNSATVGNGWVEYEKSGSSVYIDSNRMEFDSNGDDLAVNALHTFETSGDYAEVEFNAYLDRTGSDSPYFFYMQLGDSDNMVDTAELKGVAAHVVFRRYDGTHESIVAYDGSTSTLCMVGDGEFEFRITTDMTTETWTLLVHDLSTGVHTECYLTGLDFRHWNVDKVDAIRFFVDDLDTDDFADLWIDPVWVGDN